ncbi:MAG: metal ABC transporter permease [Rickettsiales bacterium]|jgi:zinc/manganese transport system permease protein
MSFYDTILLPFIDYGFMRRALAACIIMAASGAPLGVFLVLRRMTLMSEATSHAILPGAAIAFLISGAALWPMTIGGLIAGLTVALIAGVITRITSLKEDASFTAAYLASLAFGVLIISMKGSAVDLLHILFGNVLAVDSDSLFLVGSVASVSLLTMAIIYRPLIIECFDSSFLKAQGKSGAIYHQLFLILVVLNMVASFQVLGTLMAVGIIILPAIATRFWTNKIDIAIALAMFFGAISSAIGLLLSYHFSLPSGPAIVLTASAWYIISVFIGSSGGILTRFYPRKHFHLEDDI